MNLAVVLASSIVVVGSAQLLSACSGDEAHLKAFQVSMSFEGNAISVDLSGTLDKVVTAGVVALNLKLPVVGDFNGQLPFKLNPGLPANEIKMKLGPFSIPAVAKKAAGPFIKGVKGHIEVKDDNQDLVACVNLDFSHWPHSTLGFNDTDPVASDAELASQCGAEAVDHMKNLDVTYDPATPRAGKPLTASMAGDLDEHVTSGVLTPTIHVFFLKFALNIPFSISPGLSAQHYTGVIGPFTLPNFPFFPGIKGNFKSVDDKNEEIFCVDFNIPMMDTQVAAPVVV